MFRVMRASVVTCLVLVLITENVTATNRSQWTVSDTLINPSSIIGSNFGMAVACSESYVFVGANQDLNNQGAVYIFSRNTKTLA